MIKKEQEYFIQSKIQEALIIKQLLVDNLPVGNDVELPNIKIMVPLKNLSNFIFSLNFLMINTEIELILKWSQNWVLGEKVFRERKDPILGNI